MLKKSFISQPMNYTCGTDANNNVMPIIMPANAGETSKTSVAKPAI
jgi:hypothetical protein